MSKNYSSLANAIRFLSMDTVEAAKSGHPGMPMGMADVATVLFCDFLKFNPQDASWPDRDRFVLSTGHGSVLLYSLLYLTGYPDMTIEHLKQFRQWGSLTPGHPEYGHTPGVETTTGPLGQGLATAVGMALAEKMLSDRFGSGISDHHTYVIAGDGDLMEGISQEALSFAGHYKLNKLIVLFDDNHISIDGSTDLSTSDDPLMRFKASGWNAEQIDGHDFAAIHAAISRAKLSNKPSLIACRTTIAKGAPTKSGTSSSHGSPLGTKEIEAARSLLQWPYAPFDIPDDVLSVWRGAGERSLGDYTAWKKRFEGVKQVEVCDWKKIILDLKKRFAQEKPNLATRQLSQTVLEEIAPALPFLIGGSADLTGSNNTKASSQQAITPTDFSGQYIHYGIREHAMAAIMNGLSVHGAVGDSFVPYGGTFLVFGDYLRPALRLSALMGQGVIYVLTHDSIGLGEDGPTHQPVEHLASLRAIPNLNIFRPADGVEVAECWELAIADRKTPSVLALTRQAVMPVRLDVQSENLCARGGYILKEAAHQRQATLIATGSEIGLAIQAQQILADEEIFVCVVSLPCWRLFDKQPKDYQTKVLGNAPRIGIEAAIDFGWHKYIGSDGAFIGMHGFGASAPAPRLYQEFGITVDAIVQTVKQRILE
ncbi:MAG: transketolase [Alphaproteobacteria bacterium]|nr:transketolase [Alphaproteobacteria bacterium]